MNDIWKHPAERIVAWLRTGEIGAVELVTACLDRIEAYDGRLGAFIDTFADASLAQARECDRRRASGQPIGPLHGLPVAIKDIIDVEGQPTTAHSHVPAKVKADADARVVQRLRASGAIIFGKTALHEYATGGPSFDLPWPPARNPWDSTRHPGGSSSGSGVAVAAGFVPAALGTDTAGSVRHPATACGLFGFKPGYDRISRDGVFPLAQTLDHVGVLARDAFGCALVYDACREPGAPAAMPTLAAEVKGLRIGIVDGFSEGADSEIAAALAHSVALLEDLGVVATPVATSPLADFADCTRAIIEAESFAIHRRTLAHTPERLGRRMRAKVLAGAFVDAAAYLDLQKFRRRLCGEIDALFGHVDALVCVSSLHAPALIEDHDAVDRTYDRQARTVFNLTGHPAIAVPAGRSADGLPLGIQIAAPGEALVCRLAHALCRSQPFIGWPPEVSET